MRSCFVGLLIPVLAAGLLSEPIHAEPNRTAAAPDTTTLGRKTETVVVTASRKKQVLEQVPAAVSVVDSDKIANSAAENYGDLVRATPGANIAQTSASDISITTRGATGAIPQTMLVLIDHRSVYLDFNGYVSWASLPIQQSEIDRIEIVRGPGSAVWGANAVEGTVHIITREPRDAQGTELRIGGGELGTGYADLLHAGVSGKFGYRISGGYFTQGDPYSRPEGIIPGSEGPGNEQGTPYVPYKNEGTRQPKVNARLDFYQDDRTTWTVSSGWGAQEGIFLTPGGAFGYDYPESYSAYGQLDWKRDSMRATFFVNQEKNEGFFLNGDVPGSTNDQTYNLDFSDTREMGGRHSLTYGGNLRHAAYDNSLAPGGNDRESVGAYLQDDLYVSDLLRFVLGGRWDNIDPMGNAFSPRVSAVISPHKDHTFRVAYNRAFQAPSILENYIQLPNFFLIKIPDGTGGTQPFLMSTFISGNKDLDPKILDSIELGWTGDLGDRMTVSAAGYLNFFSQVIGTEITSFYTADDPPAGWPGDPGIFDVPPPDGLAGVFPRTSRFNNLGDLTNKGVELGIEYRGGRTWTLFGNYSWQDDPDTEGLPLAPLPNGSLVPAINLPPTHRFNAGGRWDNRQFFADANVNGQTETFWTDVGGPPSWGPVDSFVMVNATMGVRLNGESLELSVKALNMFDERVQQHLWGDIIDRKIAGEVRYRFQ